MLHFEGKGKTYSIGIIGTRNYFFKDFAFLMQWQDPFNNIDNKIELLYLQIQLNRLSLSVYWALPRRGGGRCGGGDVESRSGLSVYRVEVGYYPIKASIRSNYAPRPGLVRDVWSLALIGPANNLFLAAVPSKFARNGRSNGLLTTNSLNYGHQAPSLIDFLCSCADKKTWDMIAVTW